MGFLEDIKKGLSIGGEAGISSEEDSVTVSPLDEGVLDASGTFAHLKTGEYFLGDPGYAVGASEILDKKWSDWVDQSSESSDGFINPISGANMDRYPIISSNTQYGDGVYKDSDGNSYPVDSGSIGVTPVELLKKHGVNLEKLSGNGRFVTLEESGKISYLDGTVTVEGTSVKVEILTGE